MALLVNGFRISGWVAMLEEFVRISRMRWIERRAMSPLPMSNRHICSKYDGTRFREQLVEGSGIVQAKRSCLINETQGGFFNLAAKAQEYWASASEAILSASRAGMNGLSYGAAGKMAYL